MGGSRDQMARRILKEYRHLMTEAERCADRAFNFRQRADVAQDPDLRDEMSAAFARAIRNPAAEALYRKGRQSFLDDMAHRILAEHAPDLPRCEACGEALKQPNPRDCFDCNR
ncbi:MAG: hypothetical protein ACYC6Y_23400 [Thermoguttaceae bacterium]